MYNEWVTTASDGGFSVAGARPACRPFVKRVTTRRLTRHPMLGEPVTKGARDKESVGAVD